MDQEKKNREKLKKKLKEKSKKVAELCYEEKYQECLEYISTLADNAMCNFKIYEGAIHSLTHTKRYGEALALIEGHEVHGHSKTSFSFSTCLSEAVCNFELTRHLKAYHMFKDLLGHKDMDDDTRQYCTSCVKMILQTSGAEIEESITQLADELIRESKGDKHSSSSTSNVDPPVAADNPSSSLTSNVITSATIVKSIAVVVESSSLPIVFSENISFEMEELDNRSYIGLMKIGIHNFQKALIIPDEKQKKCLDESTYKASFETKGNPYLLKSEFLVYSPSLSCHLCVVEPVYPLQVFFERKLMDFNRISSASSSKNKDEWWKFIHECFKKIFRGIIRGLFAIHSAQKTCGYLDCSMYVTEGGEGTIFYVRGENFCESQAQKDLDDLFSTMESIVTLIDPRPRSEMQVWLQEFEDSYKLPRELCHFFEIFRDKKVANHMIQTTWLMDHPFFWPFRHESNFIRSLNDVFREGLIDEDAFVSCLHLYPELKDWALMTSRDSLLNAIRITKGGLGAEAEIIQFILAVLNHANDWGYRFVRAHTKLTPTDIGQLIATVFPTIYTILYEVMCVHADGLHRGKLDLLSQALERCSSLCLSP